MIVSEQNILRKILREETGLSKFTYDERSYENQIDYAIDEVLKGVRKWLQQKGLDIGIEDPDGNLFLSKKALLDDLDK